ncbi:Hypothetical protein BQ3484_314 [Cedratvirus A11]|uniref:Uncharacterized protein n=1 Tax=Cedratvirus A11 TaxID=1903266 RepID=A0A1M7XUM9_9VIRU|nr:Hypothetical protein BQ3484_314 [Cedratvirus A11]SHO33382.1 Hypothetical protein BQ3484_314 [Cedratvirus A11]
MDNVVLNIISYSEVREVLLHSLVYPDLFTEQTWKSLCKKLFSTVWSDYKYISNPRRRFVEIAYRKGLQPSGLSLYSGKYILLFTMFCRNLQKLRETAKQFPQEASALYRELSAKNNFFFRRELLTVAGEESILRLCTEDVAEAEERSDSLTPNFRVAARLLINGDETSLRILKDLFFHENPRVNTLTLSELVLEDRNNVFNWLRAYSFSKDDNMIRELLKSRRLNFTLDTVLQNLYTVNNISLAKEIEKERDYSLSFHDELECLTNYYLYSGDDKGFYQSLLKVLENKRPYIKETHIIFEVELYEIRELLEKKVVRVKCKRLSSKVMLQGNIN